MCRRELLEISGWVGLVVMLGGCTISSGGSATPAALTESEPGDGAVVYHCAPGVEPCGPEGGEIDAQAAELEIALSDWRSALRQAEDEGPIAIARHLAERGVHAEDADASDLTTLVDHDTRCSYVDPIQILFVSTDPLNPLPSQVVGKFEQLASAAGIWTHVEAVYDERRLIDLVNDLVWDPTLQGIIPSRDWHVVGVNDTLSRMMMISGNPTSAMNLLEQHVHANFAASRLMPIALWSPPDGTAWAAQTWTSTILTSTTSSFAAQLGGMMAPTNETFFRVWSEAQTNSLYPVVWGSLFQSPTGYQPYLAGPGGYLAALTLYATVFDRSTIGLPALGGVTPAQALAMQQEVDEVVLAPTSLAWDFGTGIRAPSFGREPDCTLPIW